MVSNILCTTNKSHDNNLPTTWAQVEAGVCNLTCALPGWKVIERDIIGDVLPSCIHGPAFNIPRLRDSRPWLPNLAAARWGRKQPQLGIPRARLLLCSVSKTELSAYARRLNDKLAAELKGKQYVRDGGY